MIGIELDLWTSTFIVVAFSFVVIALDEYVMKPMRHRHWERQAAAGDKEKQELLALARSARVVDE